jgi:hypothetical protein
MHIIYEIIDEHVIEVVTTMLSSSSILRQEAFPLPREVVAEDGWIHKSWKYFLPEKGGDPQIHQSRQGLQRKVPPKTYPKYPRPNIEWREDNPISETIKPTIA